MNKEELKLQICRIIDDRKDEILAIADCILRNPEVAFTETKTSATVQECFKSLGIPFKKDLAVTGVRGDLKSGKTGPTVAVMGELDGLMLPEHPFADPETGAAHACGHHAQITAMLGAAMALSAAGMKELCGNVAFIAVPAEEHMPHHHYTEMLEKGLITRTSGKQQMIHEGVFDDVDIAMMMHSGHADFTPSGFNGFVLKEIVFTGKSAHAGLTPELGINALSMARLALAAIDSQRESFKDSDSVRIHGIILEGGDAINITPSNVKASYQIRAKTPAALQDAAEKVDRAVQAAALAFGGKAEIKTESGYLPFKSSAELEEIHKNNLDILDPDAGFFNFGHRGSSTDMGDVSMIMPAIHAYSGGTAGAPHTEEFVVTDPEKAYIRPAKLLAMNVVELLYGSGEGAAKVLAVKPELTREEYFRIFKETDQVKSWDYMK